MPVVAWDVSLCFFNPLHKSESHRKSSSRATWTLKLKLSNSNASARVEFWHSEPFEFHTGTSLWGFGTQKLGSWFEIEISTLFAMTLRSRLQQHGARQTHRAPAGPLWRRHSPRSPQPLRNLQEVMVALNLKTMGESMWKRDDFDDFVIVVC